MFDRVGVKRVYASGLESARHLFNLRGDVTNLLINIPQPRLAERTFGEVMHLRSSF